MYFDLLNYISADRVKFNEEMKNHTTFRIGGPADVLVKPKTISDILNTVRFGTVKDIPVYILGLGSNILVRDKGIRGIVIKLGNGLKTISVADKEIYAESGVSLSHIARKAAEHSLAGLEFAEGIPGSLGGAVFMNAGAYGGEMGDVLYEVTAADLSGKLMTFKAEQMELGYRSSIFQKANYIVLAVRVHLQKGNQDQIYALMRELAARRREKQPLDQPSAGSTFKRPRGHYVGPMLEEMGLKGFSIGGAEISSKHAGFIVNRGNATARDVLDLISYIQDKASKYYNVELAPEVRVIGEE